MNFKTILLDVNQITQVDNLIQQQCKIFLNFVYFLLVIVMCSTNISIISDMHMSLIHGVSKELPKAEHRACAGHIYANLKKLHKSDTLKPLFWRVASSYNEGDFKANLKTFREFDPQACDDLLKKYHRTWCRAFF